MRSVRLAWLRLDMPEGMHTFETAQLEAECMHVPRGFEEPQRALKHALKCYDAALEGLTRATENARPGALETAWGHMDDGDVLLALAVQLARQT
ncbi:MAG: hypothetical protein JW990_04790 [Thermoleophilia bacterium]|nr:hypothetical protein [Thermoleophilia bacterium]